MKIYLLERVGHAGWDENEGFIVSAMSPRGARKLAAGRADCEGAAVWEDPDKSTCELLGSARPRTRSGVVLRAFKTG
jgi:hypothetical protein